MLYLKNLLQFITLLSEKGCLRKCAIRRNYIILRTYLILKRENVLQWIKEIPNIINSYEVQMQESGRRKHFEVKEAHK